MIQIDFLKENGVKVLVIIPCYNEEKNLERVINRLEKVAPEVDYIIVNDCSTDDSVAVCEKNGYNYVSLPINLGIGGGVQSGYIYAVQNGYDIAVQMDGDGQHNPKYLQEVIKPVADGTYDMCIGSRFITKEGFQTSFMRRLGINILSLLIRILCGAHVKDTTSGFRACNKDMSAYFAKHYAQDYPEPEAIMSSVLGGWKVGEVPVVMEERIEGASSISPLKSVYYMVKVSISLFVFRITQGKKAKK